MLDFLILLLIISCCFALGTVFFILACSICIATSKKIDDEKEE